MPTLLRHLPAALAAALALAPCTQPARADAPAQVGLQLPTACADINARSVNTTATPRAGFVARAFSAVLPGRAGAPETSFSASTLDVTSADQATRPAQLEQAASAAAAATLIALTGRHQAGCPNRALQEIARPIVDGLLHGDSYDANWRGLTLYGASGHVSASLMRLDLQAEPYGGLVHVRLIVTGINGVLKPPALLPDRVSVDISLPAARLPDLLSTLGGNGAGVDIPVTVEHLVLVSGPTTITGSGTMTSAPTLPASGAHLQLDATNYDALVKRAALLDLPRVHTALFLCQLVGRKDGATLHWDVILDRGVLAVNQLPLPVF